MISATVQGRITEPQMKDANGQAVLEFSIASNDGTRDEKHTTFVKASIWGKRAESVKDLFSKGARVTVCGSLKQREWEGRDGTTRKDLEMRVDQFEIIDYPDDDAKAPATGGHAPAAPPTRAPQSPQGRAAPTTAGPWRAPGTEFFPAGSNADNATHYATPDMVDFAPMPKRAGF